MVWRTASLLAGLSLLVGALAPAPGLAAPAVPDSIEAIEALCPDIGGTGLRFGLSRDRQDQSALARVTAREPGRMFDEAVLDFSTWSDRLYRVSWFSAMVEGAEVENPDWPDALGQLLEANGWQALDNGQEPDSGGFDWGRSAYRKDFPVEGKSRVLQIDVEMFGNYALECSDVGLAEMAELEAVGTLEPGSLRPVLATVAKADLPDPSDCGRPDIQDMFSSNEKLAAAGYKIEQFIPVASASSEAARFGERMNSWLRWKMLDSGKIDQDELWRIEESLDIDASKEKIDDMMAFLEQTVTIIEAQKKGDGVAACKGLLTLLAKQRVVEEAEALRWAKINAALETDALRRGIAID